MQEIHTVGDLRKAIENRGDDELVHAQAVAGDGTCFNLQCYAGPVYNVTRGVVIKMTHPNLALRSTQT